ncbi:cytochrome c peroxidase [Lacipirellula parvula]|uniref:Putative cytochrome-c peroxidase n=1 Tax=Lacipirellula parvula TaxID=2650471 RepID=A0A5K7XBM4_9BACT|nr:cytochrome c peroxidase [Lacipirellula parvula]BBO33908.1 putative cytochrome-c peroxidase [Lacipirellula parvula]
MSQRRVPLLPALLALTVLNGVAASLRADSPGVPALPATTANYRKYAVDDLPQYFKAGAIASMNNTPRDPVTNALINDISNAGATLGRVLFYDERLSHNDGLSCSSCHRQANDFSDPSPKSTGFEGGHTRRHSMGLSNAAYYGPKSFFWDQRAATLEQQVLMPIQDPVEMGTNLTQLTAELSATKFYPSLFQNAFGSPEVTSDKISKALSQFVRSMVSYQSKFDQAVKLGSLSNPNYAAAGYTAQEQLGAQLFHGEGRCSSCHVTAAQVGDAPRNIGLDADSSADLGVASTSIGQFKTPSLRNVEVRAGYTHDGRFTSLEQVVAFYSSGIQDNPFLDLRLRDNFLATGQPYRPNFDATEQAALVAFLKTLTDQSFLNNELFSDPFEDLPGDFNNDGEVDSADLAVWKTAFGATAGADADGDNDSDGQDFLVWQQNLGRSWEDFVGANIPTAAAVPEPSAAAILAIAAIALAPLHRRLKRS